MFNDNDQIRKMAVGGFVVAEFLIFFFFLAELRRNYN